VYEWAKGTKFGDIVPLTNVLEGSIVRCIMRLDETCRDVRNAARVIGDVALYQKMVKASELIKRSGQNNDESGCRFPEQFRSFRFFAFLVSDFL
jgi:hypothetical protein